jgi:hypothetical protein
MSNTTRPEHQDPPRTVAGPHRFFSASLDPFHWGQIRHQRHPIGRILVETEWAGDYTRPSKRTPILHEMVGRHHRHRQKRDTAQEHPISIEATFVPNDSVNPPKVEANCRFARGSCFPRVLGLVHANV